VTIPAAVVGAQTGHPLLPRIYATMIGQLFPPRIAPSLDRSIYSMGKGRMWRLPNRRRTDNGRYKVPVAIREVLHASYAELEPLSHRPRRGVFWPPEENLPPCPGLVQLYQRLTSAVASVESAYVPEPRSSPAASGDVEILLRRCAFLRHCQDEAATLHEPEWYAMVSNVVQCADGPTAVHQLSLAYPGYSPRETDAKIAHALRDSGPHTCAFIQALGFQGCPPGGCGVKAPIALSHRVVPSVTAGTQERLPYAAPPLLRGLYHPTDSRTRGEGRYV
jgi:hypothetical protein